MDLQNVNTNFVYRSTVIRGIEKMLEDLFTLRKAISGGTIPSASVTMGVW